MTVENRRNLWISLIITQQSKRHFGKIVMPPRKFTYLERKKIPSMGESSETFVKCLSLEWFQGIDSLKA